MKLKLVILSLACFAVGISYSQTNTQAKSLKKPAHLITPPVEKTNELPVIFGKDETGRSVAADQYILDIKSLRAYFKKGKIPRSFPDYRTDLSFEENKSIAVKWANKHKRLLTKEKRAWLNEKTNS